jgi:hypothetical protein
MFRYGFGWESMYLLINVFVFILLIGESMALARERGSGLDGSPAGRVKGQT